MLTYRANDLFPGSLGSLPAGVERTVSVLLPECEREYVKHLGPLRSSSVPTLGVAGGVGGGREDRRR